MLILTEAVQHAPAADADAATTAASSPSASGGCATTAQSRPGQLVALVHRAQAVEPDRRDAEWLYTRRDITASAVPRPCDASRCGGRAGPRSSAGPAPGTAPGVGHDDHEAPEARRVALALDDLEDVGAEPQERHPLVAAAEVEAGRPASAATVRPSEPVRTTTWSTANGAVGVGDGRLRLWTPRSERQAVRGRSPVTPGAVDLEDPSSPPGQLQPLLAERDESPSCDAEAQRLPRLRRVAEDDHCSSQTVVPSRSNTRRPSVSHFATPGVAVGRALDRADDDVADAVAVEQRARLGAVVVV